VVDWTSLEATWRGLVTGLVEAFAGGEAQVAPREASVCRSCARQALCRIGAALADDEEAA
jgi:hypothetical protein